MCTILGVKGTDIAHAKLLECFDRTIFRGPDIKQITHFSRNAALGQKFFQTTVQTVRKFE